MTKILILSILLILHLEDIKAARILGVFPSPAISHQIVYRQLVHELARRGHEVTVITTDPVYPPGQAPKNLTEIDVRDLSYKLWKDEFFKANIEKDADVSYQMSLILRVIFKCTVSQLKTKEVQDIVNKKKGEFDLLLLEAYVQPALIYSHFFKVPVILVSSLGWMKYNFRSVGAPTHPLLYPNMFHKKLYNLTNWEKLQQLYDHWKIEHEMYKVEQESDEIIKSMFGSDIPSLYELTNNVDMLFLNVNPIWLDNHPVPNNVVYIGGIHMTPRKELPKDLKSFLDSSKNGVIYFSLGTNVNTSAMPPELTQLLLKVFSKLPFNVLWRWGKDVPGLTENIKIYQWVPQSDLLRHPNVKLFITQGGMQSTDEAINGGVPIIGLPLIADQWYNAQKCVYHKIGVQLDLGTLTEEQLTKAIETVTGDKRYRENVIRLRTLMADQPQSPMETAVWWTEYVLRHGGARHLRSRGANITWAEYLELELVSIVVLTILFILTIVSTSVYILCKKFKPDKKRKVA